MLSIISRLGQITLLCLATLGVPLFRPVLG